MNIYALAKLIESVEEVDSRKRLQKCIYLLQEAGCDLGAEYVLHLYGPYSRDVAVGTDQLEEAGIIQETVEDNGCGGVRYRYEMTEDGKRALDAFEQTSEGMESKSEVGRYLPLFRQLNGIPVWTLELASTIAFFHFQEGSKWAIAKSRTAEFKQVRVDAGVLTEAQNLAKKYTKKMPA